MRVFKTEVFLESVKKQRIKDTDLIAVAEEFSKGNKGVEIQKNLFKKRVKRQGAGKSGGYRMYLAYQKGSSLFFILSQDRKDANKKNKQSKNEINKKSNSNLKLSAKQLLLLKRYAEGYLEMEDKDIERALKNNTLYEILMK